MLLDIRRLVQERGRVTLTDLALHFGRDPEAMRGMLDHWIAKGLVRRTVDPGCASSGCGGCSAGRSVEIFEWVRPGSA
ncbi:FeoC-like transcriptional regulator (plasmid) [Cereibacter azotoformans]|uniref:FeoC-like transcriptional regulator n=1 Tax=Cereibacter azotoformans TaxID=43057 RepID=UPI000C6D7695|nr:FeoC-like transcriptional regulator [Cereibacter azotoformans]